MLKKPIPLVAGLVALLVLACWGRVDSPGTTDCPTGQRFFNGACAPTCVRHEDCTGGSICLQVGTDGALCAQPPDAAGAECVYLSSDTECVGVGVYYWSYGPYVDEGFPYTSDPEYADPSTTTNFDDPSFRPNSPYYVPNAGCRGNATWVTVPATSNPGCGQPHAVRRCRFERPYNCFIVDGTTFDRPNL
jgi:hypothetical protein